LTFALYRGFNWDNLGKAFFFFFFFAAAPVLGIGFFWHAGPAILTFVVLVAVVVKKTSRWWRVGLLSALFILWETYGIYCSSYYT
jgi:hypothetical protein